MPDIPTDPVENLRNWAALHVQNTERDLAKSMFTQLLSQTGSLDSFSNWFLLLIGASTALVIPNLEAVSKILPFGAIRWFLLLFIGSALCGVAQKFFAMSVDMRLRLAGALEKDWAQRLQAADEEEKKIQAAATHWGAAVDTKIDIHRVVAPVLEVTPNWVKKRAKKKAEAGLKDPLDSYKDGLRAFIRQSWCFAAQCVFILAATVVIAVSIGRANQRPEATPGAVTAPAAAGTAPAPSVPHP
jgi:hypothetical protein